VDSYARLISEVNNLVVKHDDQQGDLCESFFNWNKRFILFFIAINETLLVIRRQYEELEREKQNFLLQHTSHEETFRFEVEKITAEKE
jgi:hypothetical protein